VQFTPEGRDRAEHVMRKHRLAERLLVDVLGLEHEHVHEEACRWEHVISDRVESKLLEFLGNPTTSPYGNPIPGVEPLAPGNELVSLADAPTGTVTIERISEQLQGDRDVMHRLDEVGVTYGGTAEVSRDGDAVILEVDGRRLSLGPDAAKLVYVSSS
jgi:DtxR family transcriptional regulator, Mn-dependent transcriptional regulator